MGVGVGVQVQTLCRRHVCVCLLGVFHAAESGEGVCVCVYPEEEVFHQLLRCF